MLAPIKGQETTDEGWSDEQGVDSGQSLKLGVATQHLECQIMVERENMSLLCGAVSRI